MFFTSPGGNQLQASVLGLGTANFGSQISEAESFAMLDAFVEAGGNFADTAHIYASWLPQGAAQSERTLGKWLASRQPRDFLVGTKGGHPDLSSMEISRLDPASIARDLEESLERLGLDSVAIYWLHRDDPQVPVGEILDALHPHVQAGRVRALGASNWSVARLESANRAAAQREISGFCISQIAWSLADFNAPARGGGGTVQMDAETLEWHRSNRFPLAAYSAQANGYFSHALPAEGAELTDKQKALDFSYGNAPNARRFERARELGARLGRSAAEVALAYVWSQKFPAIALIGASSREQLNDSLKAADLRLSAEEVAFLED